MRAVILFIAQSLDGYIADSDGGIDWLNDSSVGTDDDFEYDRLIDRIDTVILGNKTYTQIINELAIDHYPYADKMSYVFTHHKQESSQRVQFIDGDVVEFVKELKATPGKDIWIVGGASIINPLLKENLIDQIELAIIPTVLNDGISLFEQKQKMFFHINHVKHINNIVYISLRGGDHES